MTAAVLLAEAVPKGFDAGVFGAVGNGVAADFDDGDDGVLPEAVLNGLPAALGTAGNGDDAVLVAVALSEFVGASVFETEAGLFGKDGADCLGTPNPLGGDILVEGTAVADDLGDTPKGCLGAAVDVVLLLLVEEIDPYDGLSVAFSLLSSALVFSVVAGFFLSSSVSVFIGAPK